MSLSNHGSSYHNRKKSPPKSPPKSPTPSSPLPKLAAKTAHAFHAMGHGIEKAAKTAAAPIQRVIPHHQNKRNEGLVKTKQGSRNRIGLFDEFSTFEDDDADKDGDASVISSTPSETKNIKFQAHDFHGQHSNNFYKYYSMGRLIYKTRFCRVNVCRSYLTKQERVVKVVRETTSECHEFEILKDSDHPNVPTMYEVFQGKNKNEFFLVMKYCQGGTLLDLLHGNTQRPIIVGPPRILEGGKVIGGFVQGRFKNGADMLTTIATEGPPRPIRSCEKQDEQPSSTRATTRSTALTPPAPWRDDTEWDVTGAKGSHKTVMRGCSPTRKDRSPTRKSPTRNNNDRLPTARKGRSPTPKDKDPPRKRHSYPNTHTRKSPNRKSPNRQSPNSRQNPPIPRHDNPQEDDDCEDEDNIAEDPHEHIRRKFGNQKQKQTHCKSPLSEADAKLIMLQLLAGLCYCHDNGIVHCDVKPGNLMFNYPKDISYITLIDFDTSFRQKSPDDTMNYQRAPGTGQDAAYLAPEVVQEFPQYNHKSDVWSAGVTLYKMLSNTLPFVDSPHDTEEDIRRNILSGRPVMFPDEHWGSISRDAKEYIAYLLNRRPADRPSSRNAVNHIWLASAREQVASVLDPKLADESGAARVLHNLRKFNAADTKMKEAVCAFIATHLLTTEEVRTIDRVFQALDTQRNGKIHRFELKQAYYKVYNKFITEKELDKLMQRIDLNGNNVIAYSEFRMAAVDKHDLLSKQRLKNAFDLFDKQGKGHVTHDEVRNMFRFMDMDMNYLTKILLQVDKNNDGEISFDEFVLMMTDSGLHKSATPK
ncbi:MAP kinase-activated protein kinase 2 (Fragment) [Seminavis robusta]|uniref:MAP kinase-activated protein kinase 2 n=1 Tax=Seminavis robusta TaxID=568900 RepID=A0A9N8DJB0_9STRA